MGRIIILQSVDIAYFWPGISSSFNKIYGPDFRQVNRCTSYYGVIAKYKESRYLLTYTGDNRKKLREYKIEYGVLAPKCRKWLPKPDNNVVLKTVLRSVH